MNPTSAWMISLFLSSLSLESSHSIISRPLHRNQLKTAFKAMLTLKAISLSKTHCFSYPFHPLCLLPV
jgi:hypothetical protein